MFVACAHFLSFQNFIYAHFVSSSTQEKIRDNHKETRLTEGLVSLAATVVLGKKQPFFFFFSVACLSPEEMAKWAKIPPACRGRKCLARVMAAFRRFFNRLVSIPLLTRATLMFYQPYLNNECNFCVLFFLFVFPFVFFICLV